MSPLFIIVIGVFIFVLLGLRIAQEYERSIVFRLGRFLAIKGPGLYWIIPFIDWQKKIDIRIQTQNIEQQETITKDSVTIKVNAVLWYKVTDVSKAFLNVANYQSAVYQVALTTLRNIIGQHQLDEVLKERDKINDTMKKMVDKTTDEWGIEVIMVEMKDVEIPEAMQRAMAREAEATREKRARIIKAEAELESSVKLSEGARIIAENPAALELRRMQMISEIGAEHNTTTIILMPSEFTNLARGFEQFLNKGKV